MAAMEAKRGSPEIHVAVVGGKQKVNQVEVPVPERLLPEQSLVSRPQFRSRRAPWCRSNLANGRGTIRVGGVVTQSAMKSGQSQTMRAKGDLSRRLALRKPFRGQWLRMFKIHRRTYFRPETPRHSGGIDGGRREGRREAPVINDSGEHCRTPATPLGRTFQTRDVRLKP